MNQMLKKLTLAAVVTIIGASGSAALAAPSAWDMPAGDHGSYTYNSGMSQTGNIGSGTSFSDGFFFIPTGLRAQTNANGGNSQTIALGDHDEASDTVSVILNAKPGASFTRITSNFLGDYTIDQVGNVNATGSLRVINLDTATTLSSPLAFGGTVPASSVTSADGVFSGDTAIDLPAGWTNIRVEMDGMVSADSLLGTALIQGKDAEIGVATAEVPIPAALAVAPVAAFLGWRAKRKLAAR